MTGKTNKTSKDFYRTQEFTWNTSTTFISQRKDSDLSNLLDFS